MNYDLSQPWQEAHERSDEDAQNHAQGQFESFEPARNPIRRLRGGLRFGY
jgi:hypothetical protein